MLERRSFSGPLLVIVEGIHDVTFLKTINIATTNKKIHLRVVSVFGRLGIAIGAHAMIGGKIRFRIGVITRKFDQDIAQLMMCSCMCPQNIIGIGYEVARSAR